MGTLNWVKISHEKTKLYAETQFKKYRITQDKTFKSDFDKFLEQLPNKKENWLIKYMQMQYSPYINFDRIGGIKYISSRLEKDLFIREKRIQ